MPNFAAKGPKTGIVSTVPDNISVRSAMPGAARRSKEDDKGRMRIWKMVGAAVIVLLFIYILYPKLADVFLRARTAPAQTESAATESAPRNGLDQTGISDVEWQEQPITVVPNDYQE